MNGSVELKALLGKAYDLRERQARHADAVALLRDAFGSSQDLRAAAVAECQRLQQLIKVRRTACHISTVQLVLLAAALEE